MIHCGRDTGDRMAGRLTREEFRNQVFARDGGKCVLCDRAAADAHHIMERKLYADGGYDADNGASVCNEHHMDCELTKISVEQVRKAAGITRAVLPRGFDPESRYDKWGNLILDNGLRVAGPLASDDGCRSALARGGFLGTVVANDPETAPGLPEIVGRNIPDAARRTRWRALVHALNAAAVPGGPLDGWTFHGAAGHSLESIENDGLHATEVMMRDGDEQWWTAGTYWATPRVAAWYAEDTAEGMDPPDWDFGIVAARIADVAECGQLAPDEQTIDSPIASVIGRDAESLYAEWEADPRREWTEAYRIYESFVCLGPVGPDALCVIRSEKDLEAVIAAAAAVPGCG